MSTHPVSTQPASQGIARRATTLPFPFATDQYRYNTNVEPAGTLIETDGGNWGGRILDIDDDYLSDLAMRAQVLSVDRTRLNTMPHMKPVVWDVVTMLLPILAEEYPDSMFFSRSGDECSWRNDLLGIQLDFTVGDDSTLPMDPLEFISGQIQDDIALLDQREGSLWLDAGCITFAADWSMGFDVGMRFLEIHGPVPRIHETRVASRAEQFLMRLNPGEKFRRTNWTMTIDRRLDTSTETYSEWGRDRRLVLDDPAFADRVHLRVEVQHLIRTPTTGAILFLVRTYLISLTEIATVPAWRARLGAVLAELPDDMAEYKGIDLFRTQASAWLLNNQG